MKDLLFGAVMLLCGTIGFVGWAIACALSTGGGYASPFSCIDTAGELILAAVFAVLAVAGLVVCLKEWN